MRIPASPDASTPAQLTSEFVDEVVRRARNLTPLVEFFRAHLEARSAGASRTVAEHVVDLLVLGVRWRVHARTALRRPAALPNHDAVTALLTLLRSCGRPLAEVARLSAWNEFAFLECCPEALDEACDLAAWFERTAGKGLGQGAPGLETQLELVRAEVISRSLRERHRWPGRGLDPLPLTVPALQPIPMLRAAAARAATSRMLERVTRPG
jgi:hypothetical protein